MAKFIRRKRQHLNEDDANQTQQQPAQQPAANTTAPQQQTAPAAQTAPVQQPQQPANQAPAQQPAQDQNSQQQQQPQQQQQQQQQNQPSQEQQQVNNFLTGVRDNIQKGNIYWALSINLADEIQKAIPSFKADNQAAKPGIDAWEAFKKDPQEQTFNTFIDELSKFGAPQQEAPAEQAQQAQQLQDSLVLNFGARLEEKLNNKLKMDFYAKQIAKGVNDN